MKELTIEQKAEAYDEAIRKAKDMLTNKEVRQEDMEYLFPELKEDEDERIRKRLCAVINDIGGNVLRPYLFTKDKVLAWLEKQGEQPQGKTALESVKEENVDNQNCVNLSDKVEPKFHEGEWIISNDKKSTYQVIEVKRGIYVIRDIVDNHEYHIGIEECERDGRLWELSDAKDGDLIYVSTEDKGIQAIFHEYKNGTIFFHCYLCINFTQGGYMPIGDVEMVHPLQKIHHKRFFEEMHEAGYTFDFDKKELNKIDNK